MRSWKWIAPLPPLLVGGLAGSRVLAEAVFPAATWLLRPFPALTLALLLTAAAWALWAAAMQRRAARRAATPWALVPLLLNLLWLLDPTVDLLRSRLLLATTLWLTLTLTL
ncbi:MAG: hypothetical protein KC425_13390, partial [Anaerolineales bacterium]|nr:hypothetical protein [Anaerolineales bacterium]